MARVVIVSNRLPQPSDRGPSAGGLVVALADTLQPGTLWFGWSGRRVERPAETPALSVADGITYAAVDLTEAEYQGYYVGFANSTLWPLLHFRPGLMIFRREEYQGYLDVNRRFARELAPMLRPDDVIWIHDYHLIPLARELRALGVQNRIGFFLHVPFVPPELLEVVPCARELLLGLAACDVVGFHIELYRHAFLDGVRRILGIVPDSQSRFEHEGREVRVIVDPAGIDAAGFAAMAARAARGTEARRLRDSLADRLLTIGVDRLDYSKGLPARLVAFGRLLANHPEHRRQVNFLQVAARSREDASRYQELRRELDRIVGDTNGRYSEFDWTPLRYITRAVSRRTLAGFYRVARVGVVTPLRDGMNLVAKEYIAAQNPNDPGVLVLSRFAGAAQDLGDALIVNPFDPDEIAEAIHQALSMDLGERRARHQVLLERVQSSSAERYSRVFMSHLLPDDTPSLPEVAEAAIEPAVV